MLIFCHGVPDNDRRVSTLYRQYLRTSSRSRQILMIHKTHIVGVLRVPGIFAVMILVMVETRLPVFCVQLSRIIIGVREVILVAVGCSIGITSILRLEVTSMRFRGFTPVSGKQERRKEQTQHDKRGKHF